MFNSGTVGHAAEVERIENFIAANGQDKLFEADKVFYRNHLLTNWEDSKKRLEVAKEDEMKWRKKAVAFVFDPNKTSGTERIELDNGYEAKAVKKMNYGFIKTADGTKVDKDKIEDALEKIESTGPVGELIASRLIKWSPDLSLTEYKQLAPEFKKIIDPVLVLTPGAPTLEIIAPKGS